ncbi:7-dimethylallyltryptophan synthase [Hypsizygus marmoreus]|uniref:7-dimethylallyltryptophan synthase n=1 Tax=Hypsizygus marmoreus TaxID=39966 RepID=A0A369K7J4_HYPMA|nr:7-dimethylallyltryptophan synthase [Hypsizygus marmoreus]
MSPFPVDFSKFWKDGRYFAQVPTFNSLQEKTPSDGSLVGDVVAVTTDLLGGSYKLGAVASPFKPHDGLEVYDALTQILPVLSSQSDFFWKRVGRSLASQLSTAKYPIRSQTSHLVFWWARLGGIMGATSIAGRVGDQSECTSDGSNLEYSWAIPRDTDPTEDSNRRIRFTIDPFHPEFGHRIAGGAVLDYLYSDEGSLGLIKKEPGSKDWKDILEKWLFPDIASTEELVEGTTYMIAFDMEPSGEITLKSYYIPPHPPLPGLAPKNEVATYRVTDNMEPFKKLVKQLHPSLEAPFKMFADYIAGPGKDSGMMWFMIACDITKLEKNRLKLYLLSQRTTLKDMIYDMTLGGQITGPRVDDAMKNFSKFFTHLFPYAKSDDTGLIRENYIPEADEEGRVGRGGLRMMYYYEFFVGETVPYPKIYFFMDHFSKNDLQTVKSTELFFKDIGKPGHDGWLTEALAHANQHRPLEKRNGLHTMVSFGTKPTGWEITNYYSAEVYAAERDVPIV